MIGFEVEHVLRDSGGSPTICEIPYKKENPLMTGNADIHQDATMLELALLPTDTIQQSWEVYERALEEAKELLREHGYENHTLHTAPAAGYSGIGERYSQIGCSPSMTPYTFSRQLPQEYKSIFRFAGLHVNLDTNAETDHNLLAQYLDLTLGLHSVIHWEQQYRRQSIVRRQYYGRVGEHRSTDFGIEYRTLPSSSWSRENLPVIQDQVNKAFQFYEEGRMISGHQKHRIQTAIQHCDARTAQQLKYTFR